MRSEPVGAAGAGGFFRAARQDGRRDIGSSNGHERGAALMWGRRRAAAGLPGSWRDITAASLSHWAVLDDDERPAR